MIKLQSRLQRPLVNSWTPLTHFLRIQILILTLQIIIHHFYVAIPKKSIIVFCESLRTVASDSRLLREKRCWNGADFERTGVIVWGFGVKGSDRRGNHPQRLQLLFVHLISYLKLLLSQKTGLQQLLRIPTTPATTPLPPTAHLRYLNHGHLPHDPPLRKHLGTDSSIEPTELAKSRRGRLKIQVALRGVQVYLQRVGVVEGRQA